MKRTTRLICGALFGALSLYSTIGHAAPASVAGVWQQFDDDGSEPQALITITEHGGLVEGTVTRIFPAAGEPANPTCGNCKGAKKDKPVVGMKVLERMKRASDGSYEGGTITDPESGTEYRCRLALSEDGKSLNVRGFVGVSLFGRTQEWKRAQ